jgi:hypothetical protein
MLLAGERVGAGAVLSGADRARRAQVPVVDLHTNTPTGVSSTVFLPALRSRNGPWSAARGLWLLLLLPQGLRTLGLGGIRCQDIPTLAPLTLLRHLMLEPAQPPRPVNDAPASQRDLAVLDTLMCLPQGAMAGLRTLWLPNWAMPIKQLLQWQQMLQVRPRNTCRAASRVA